MSETRTCDNGHRLNPDAAFCPFCGGTAAANGGPSILCPAGHFAQPGDGFCPTCGIALRTPSAATATAQARIAQPNVTAQMRGPSVPLTSLPPPTWRPGPNPWPAPAYPYGPTVPPPSTNGMAIASLILGLLWLWGLGAVLALIFGVIAKNQIDRSNGREGGRGLAIAGIVLGSIGIASMIIVTIAVVAATSNTSS